MFYRMERNKKSYNHTNLKHQHRTKGGQAMSQNEIKTIFTNLTASGYTEEEAREIINIILLSL